jgi:hypothetical protein
MSVKNEHDLTRAEVAYGLDVDDRTVSRYQDRADRPLPVKERRRTKAGNRYDLREVIAWAVEDALAKVCKGSDGNRYHYAAERARLTKAQADKTELEVAELRGDLISTPSALAQVEAIVTNAMLVGIDVAENAGYSSYFLAVMKAMLQSPLLAPPTPPKGGTHLRLVGGTEGPEVRAA